MYRGLGQSAIDYSAPWATAWYCLDLGGLSTLIPACTPPTPVQVAAGDTTSSGAGITAAQQAAIDATTLGYALTDPALAPVCDATQFNIAGTCVSAIWFLGAAALLLLAAAKK
jgi:hypothetical protein